MSVTAGTLATACGDTDTAAEMPATARAPATATAWTPTTTQRCQ